MESPKRAKNTKPAIKPYSYSLAEAETRLLKLKNAESKIHSVILDMKEYIKELHRQKRLGIDSESKLALANKYPYAAQIAISDITEREIIILKYISEGMKLKDIAQRLSVSSSRIAEIRNKTLRKLRHPSRRNLCRSELHNLGLCMLVYYECRCQEKGKAQDE
ncbi:MAG: sigma factor-like helix-turn-helix DNA-binding protein [Candidatus Paceibacterota bacterium]|jgi:DNA-binding CsgD family transcriptional regulator